MVGRGFCLASNSKCFQAATVIDRRYKFSSRCSGAQPRLGETGCRRQPTDMSVGAFPPGRDGSPSYSHSTHPPTRGFRDYGPSRRLGCGFSSLWPAQAHSRRRPQLLPNHTRRARVQGLPSNSMRVTLSKGRLDGLPPKGSVNHETILCKWSDYLQCISIPRRPPGNESRPLPFSPTAPGTWRPALQSFFTRQLLSQHTPTNARASRESLNPRAAGVVRE